MPGQTSRAGAAGRGALWHDRHVINIVTQQKRKYTMKKKNAKSTSRRSAKSKAMESKEAREMRKSIEEMEGELVELDRDIVEARKGDRGDMSAVALDNFLQMRRDMVEMIESNKDLYKTLLESEELARRLERKYA